MPRKILVVDDDRKILETVKRYLSAEGMAVIATSSGSEALLLAQESKPDLVLTDAEMPGMDGHALCRALKKEGATRGIPVIMMSGSRIADKDVLSGFAGGADDYVSKPFSLNVLGARILAVLRRYEAPALADGVLKACGLNLDPAGRTATVDKKPVALTRKEFDLLAALLSKPGKVLSINYLLETVWGYDPADYNDPGTVEVHVSHLRKKLGPRLSKAIVTVTGHGYKFEVAQP